MQYNGKKSFFPFPWIEGKLKAQTSDFILSFPKRVWFLPIQSQENVFLEVLLHKTHMLFQDLRAFIKS